MKKYFLFIILICSTHLYAQKVVQVRGAKMTPTYLKISQIKNTDIWTEVVLEFSPVNEVGATLHEPNGKSPFVLKDRQGKEHLIVYQKGWDGPNPGGYGSIQLLANKSKTVSLFFNKINDLDNIESLNESNCEGNGCWFFKDIVLVDESAGVKISDASTLVYTATVDYDVVQDGQTGLRIILSFELRNLKDTNSFFEIRFQNENNDYLMSNNAAYSDDKEQILVRKNFKPGYLISGYSDIPFFVPNSAFDLPTGLHKLKFDIDLGADVMAELDHISLYTFDFTVK
jgi:hypothetical protein